jgi:hypothetical protein
MFTPELPSDSPPVTNVVPLLGLTVATLGLLEDIVQE